MSRTDIQVGPAFSPSPAVAPPSGRLMAAGQAGQGPTTATRVRSLAEWVQIFGPRTGAPAVYDGLQTFFAEGGADCMFVRAVGPKAAAASVSLETDKIVVTARHVGPVPNAWTVAWSSASKTLTIVAGADKEVYTGATFDELIAAASVSTRVAVSGKGFPSADVAATPLSGGADDYKGTEWPKTLAKFTADMGPGAVAVFGEPYTVVGAAVAEHCGKYSRLGVVTFVAGTSAGQAVTGMQTIVALTGSANVVAAWPCLNHPALAGVKVDPAGYIAGVRARQHAASGPGQSLLRSHSVSASGVTPEVEATEDEADALIKARVSDVRTINGIVQLDGWYTATPSLGLANLAGAQFADLIDYVRSRAQLVADAHLGQDMSPKELASFKGALLGMLASVPGPAFYRRLGEDGSIIDPGYTVDVSEAVNPISQLREGRLHAAIRLRLMPSTEFVTISITAGDAALVL